MHGSIWPRHRLVLSIMSGLLACGCYSWRLPPSGVSPSTYVAEREPGRVRLTLTDGSRVELVRPWLFADSIFGRRNDVDYPVTHESNLPVQVIWVGNVTRIEERQVRGFASGALVGAVVGSAAGLVTAGVASSCSGGSTMSVSLCGMPTVGIPIMAAAGAVLGGLLGGVVGGVIW
jgi:hypothetical protein